MKNLYEHLIKQHISNTQHKSFDIIEHSRHTYVCVDNIDDYDLLISFYNWRDDAYTKMGSSISEYIGKNIYICMRPFYQGEQYAVTWMWTNKINIGTKFKIIDKILPNNFTPEYWEKHNWT